MRHGEITRPGDEFNKDTFYFCAKCLKSHTTNYAGCDGLRTPIPIQDLVTCAEEKHNPVNPLVGGKLSGDHYYRVEVSAPIAAELPPYTAECSDIIEALDMTFNEGEAFKAIWRLAAARQGRGKPGNKPQYDADKAAHYGGRIAVQTRKAKE